jgi:hypothetical protein
MIRKLVGCVLRKHGYFVLEADGPTEARRLWNLHRHSIGMLFADFIIPITSGPELAEEFLAANPDLKIVLRSVPIA